MARAGEPSFKAAGAMKAEAVARHMVATSRERRAAIRRNKEWPEWPRFFRGVSKGGNKKKLSSAGRSEI